jgi:hypothetical protein
MHYGYEKPEFIGQFIDTFEDYCDEKGYDIPNEEKEADGAEDTHIYGEDYDFIAEPVREAIGENESSFHKVTKEVAMAAIRRSLVVFAGLVKADVNQVVEITADLTDKLYQLFVIWDLIGEEYYVTIRMDTRTTIKVVAASVEEAVEIGEDKANDLSTGDLGEVVENYANAVEKDGNIVWDRA